MPKHATKMWSRRFLSFTRTSLLVACVVLTFLGTQGFSQQPIKPEDQETTIVGTIKLIHGYGPPGYGEDPKHDTRVSYWAVEVPVPVNLSCTSEKKQFVDTDCASAKRLKLFFPGDGLMKLSELPAAKWEGKMVVVKGKLHRADTAGEMTLIFMDVTKISAAPRTTNR